MPTENNNSQIVDIEELKEIMDDDMELIQECFAQFVKDWPIAYVEIKGAILEKNAPNLNTAAHKLKGTLKYLAAKNAANATLALETAGKDNDLNGAEEKLETLKKACQKLIEYINTFTY